MKDSRCISVIEAAQNEISEQFVANIKRLDETVAWKRLATILIGNRSDMEFISIAAQFNAVFDHRMSVDHEK